MNFRPIAGAILRQALGKSLGLACGFAWLASVFAAEPYHTEANVPVEIAFSALHAHDNPFEDIALDVTFTDPAGMERSVPAFWAGGQEWKVRYASPLTGTHRWRSACTDPTDAGLQGIQGSVEVAAFTANHPLFLHGPVRVAADKRRLEHADGTPFFWLGDTWWMGLCHRLQWPAEFQELTADRKLKGFNVIQLVMGLYPDMHPFDPRGANEAGYPWETNYTRIRPQYFDAADRRIRYLVDQGFTPCLVGAWGYFLPWMGVKKMETHWRYLIARYSAWPVVWCVAGEANLPWYLAKGFPFDDRGQVHDWTEVLRYVRASDPFRRPLTIHPTGIGRLSARNATDDVSLLDIDMLQTPHGQREAVAPTVKTARESYADQPVMPVINGEASYEMLFDRIPADWPRAMFWVCMMNGAAGHTYGANGIWQCNRRGTPHGPSPHGSGGNGYGVISWDEAMRLPGSQQVAYGKQFLLSLPWSRLRPMPDSVAWADADDPVTLGPWIWFPEGEPRRDAPTAVRFFRRSFELPPKRVVRAMLEITADDRFTAWLNGKELGSAANWRAPARLDVTAALKPGANLLAVRAENSPAPGIPNPAGLSATLGVTFADDSRITVPTDGSWRAARSESPNWNLSEFDDSGWSAAMVAAQLGDAPWGRVGAADLMTGPQACGIDDQLRVIYSLDARPVVVRSLRPGTPYRATRFDPVQGERATPDQVRSDAGGSLRLPAPAHGHDWVLLLERNNTP